MEYACAHGRLQLEGCDRGGYFGVGDGDGCCAGDGAWSESQCVEREIDTAFIDDGNAGSCDCRRLDARRNRHEGEGSLEFEEPGVGSRRDQQHRGDCKARQEPMRGGARNNIPFEPIECRSHAVTLSAHYIE